MRIIRLSLQKTAELKSIKLLKAVNRGYRGNEKRSDSMKKLDWRQLVVGWKVTRVRYFLWIKSSELGLKMEFSVFRLCALKAHGSLLHF